MAKPMSIDEIKKIAPNYRGKPENFDTAKAGKKRMPPRRQPLATAGPSSPDVPVPSHINVPQTPTPQRNESIISESIFGVDIRVTPIEPHQQFSSNYAKLPKLTEEVFDQYSGDEKYLDRTLERAELVYYTTGLLWMRLIDIKAKHTRTTLTSAEKDIRKATMDETFNVPQPIYAYLSQIGDVTDKMGKETEVEIPDLPVTVLQTFGGYIADTIGQANHNLFEEIPSLGIAADSVMALASDQAAPQVAMRLALPAGASVTSNLLCYSTPLAARRQEIVRRLAGLGITNQAFPEYVATTRFNIRYMKQISDIVGKLETYRVEKVIFRNMTRSGGETQVVMTKPVTTEDANQNWQDRTVTATSAACESTALMGAAYPFGYQLYKEAGDGASLTLQHANWSCISATPNADLPWAIPQAWVDTRNARRDLPAGIGTERFRAMSLHQATVLSEVVRRMIKTTR